MNCEIPEKENLYGVIAETENYQKPLVLLNLPFGRILDEIIIPYDTDVPFFIDGVPVSKIKIKRIKIIELNEQFNKSLWELERGLKRSDSKTNKIYGDQYDTRFEHILRNDAVDVTSQVLKAYDKAIKPCLKDYLPKRPELISAATTIFVEAMKQLTGRIK